MSHQIRRNTTSFFPNGGTERRSLVKPTDAQTVTLLETEKNEVFEEDHTSEDDRRYSILSNSTNQN